MKRFKVYEIIDNNGKIIHVGYTKRDIEIRFKEHLRSKFKNKINLNVRLVKDFNSKTDALLFEGEHKINNGLEWTERNGNGGRAVGPITGRINGIKYWLKNRKLTNQQVEEIKLKYSTGNYTQQQLANEYGFKTHKSIGFILHDKQYKNKTI